MDGKPYTYVQGDEIKKLTPRGHYLLVRRHKTPVDQFLVDGDWHPTSIPFQKDGSQADREEFIQTAVESLAQNIENPLCEVLAIGPDVGKPRPRKELKRLRLVEFDTKGKERLKDCIFVGKVGDTVGLPECAGSGRMFRGVTGQEFDVMVDEGELIGAYIPKDAT